MERIEAEYKRLEPVAQELCTKLRDQIETLLEGEQIILGFPLQSRVKDWISMSTKLGRMPHLVHTIKDVQDFIGLRLVLLFKRDVALVCKLISDHFQVVRQYDTQSRLKEDQFGYSSTHIILKLPKNWIDHPSLTEAKGLKAEVQVRTIAQHAWATASHVLQYKQQENVPQSVLRAIYRVSALLETVDLEFERVLEQRELYRVDIKEKGRDDVLNTDSLQALLDYMLPAVNKMEDEDYQDLLNDLRHFGIDTTFKLKNLIHNHLEFALERDAMLIDSIQARGKLLELPPERLDRGVLSSYLGLVRNMIGAEFGQQWEDYKMDKWINSDK